MAERLLRPAIRYLDHVGIAVHDADEALSSYAAAGLSVVHDERLPHVGVRLVYLLPSGLGSPLGMTSIQLVQPIGAGPVRQWMDERGEGLH
ncbi:MAG: hypothetical protein ACRDT6_26205, partial [Micromonosporaceae bacterium]